MSLREYRYSIPKPQCIGSDPIVWSGRYMFGAKARSAANSIAEFARDCGADNIDGPVFLLETNEGFPLYGVTVEASATILQQVIEFRREAGWWNYAAICANEAAEYGHEWRKNADNAGGAR